MIRFIAELLELTLLFTTSQAKSAFLIEPSLKVNGKDKDQKYPRIDYYNRFRNSILGLRIFVAKHIKQGEFHQDECLMVLINIIRYSTIE